MVSAPSNMIPGCLPAQLIQPVRLPNSNAALPALGRYIGFAASTIVIGGFGDEMRQFFRPWRVGLRRAQCSNQVGKGIGGDDAVGNNIWMLDLAHGNGIGKDNVGG